MRFNKLLFILTTLGVLVVTSDSATVAATATANLNINATVGANCTISTIAVAFPTYDPVVTHASTPDDSTAGSVTVTCTKGSGTSIALGYGGNPLPASQPRMKDSGTNFLNYMLYSESTRTTAWSGASLAIAAAPDKNPRVFTVYGRIAAAQDVPAGSYSDTVVATVNF